MPPNQEPRPGGNRTGLVKHLIDNSSADDIAEINGRTQPCDAHSAKHLAELRFHRDVQKLVGLGARPVLEMLLELGGEHGIEVAIAAKVAKYAARLSPELLRLTGGDRMPPNPIHLVEARR